MSVIVRFPDGSVKLLIKGADTILDKLLRKHDNAIRDRTWKHLAQMAHFGLRTLLVAQRSISEEEYKEWSHRYSEATLALVNRDQKIEQVQAEIEVNLELLGATGIEDKLQDEVAETMKAMTRAGIRVWVLTGDKLETAVLKLDLIRLA